MPEYKKNDNWYGFKFKTIPVGIRKILRFLPHYTGINKSDLFVFEIERLNDKTPDFETLTIEEKKTRFYKILIFQDT